LKPQKTVKSVAKTIKLDLSVSFEKEGDYFVAYCPALELSSYGKSEASAKKSFDEALEIFIEETVRKGTLLKILLELGWTLRQKPSVLYKPPTIKKPISSRPNSRTIRETVQFPSLA